MNDLVHALMEARRRHASKRLAVPSVMNSQNPFRLSGSTILAAQGDPEVLPRPPLDRWGPPVDELPGFLDGLDNQPTPDEREAKARTAQNIEMLIEKLEDANDPRVEKARFCQSHFPNDAKKFEACFKAKEQPV